MSPLKAAVVQVVATWVVAVIFKIVSHFLHTPVEEFALIIACNALVLMLMHKSNDGQVGRRNRHSTKGGTVGYEVKPCPFCDQETRKK